MWKRKKSTRNRGGFVLAVAIALTVSGCGGWIRSRFPDPNASGTPSVSSEEAQVQTQPSSSPPSVGAEAESSLAAESVDPNLWQLPPEPARELVWGLWRSGSKDGTVPSAEHRESSFLDGSAWRTLDSGNLSQAQGILPGGNADLEDPIQWRSDSGTKAPLFVVLNPTFAGQRVIATLYETEVRDGMNHPVLKRDRRLGRQDPESGNWFVPVSEVLGDQAAQWVSPHHQFTLRWELELANQVRVSVSTTFQIQIPPPRLVRISQQGVRSASAGSVLDSDIDKRMLHSEIWQNTSKRELDLWLAAWSRGVSETHTVLRKEPKLENRSSPEVHWEESRLQSTASYLLGSIQVDGGRVLQGSGSDSEGAWIRVRLSPGEEVRVQWGAALKQSDFPAGCSFSRKKKVTLVWHSIEHSSRRCENGCDVSHESNRFIHWSQTGGRFSGDVESQAFVSEPLQGDLDESIREARSDSDRLSLLEGAELARKLEGGGWSRTGPAALGLPVWHCNEGDPEN